MDNGFIQFLFFLLIIVFFLSSLFKKKPAPPRTDRPIPQPPDQNEENNSSEEIPPVIHYKNEDKEDNDILNEVENLFKNRIPENPQPVKRQTKIESYSQSKAGPEPAAQSTQQEPQNDYVTPKAGVMSTVKEIQKIDSKIEEEAKKFEMLLARQDEVYSFAADIRKKIANVESLREYIIVSEILGRPKALHR